MPSPKGDGALSKSSSVRMVGWGCCGVPSSVSVCLSLLGCPLLPERILLPGAQRRCASVPSASLGTHGACWWFLRDDLERIGPFPYPALLEPVPAEAAMMTYPLNSYHHGETQLGPWQHHPSSQIWCCWFCTMSMVFY